MTARRRASVALGAALSALGIAMVAGLGLPPHPGGVAFVALGLATAVVGLLARSVPPPAASARAPDRGSAELVRVVGAFAAEPALPAIPGWRLGAVLGRGGMGTVHRAWRDGDGAPAAVKVLHPHLAGDEAAWGRLQREIAILGRLDHRGIIRCLDHGRAEGRPWLAMELVEGCDLRRVLADGPLSAAEALRVVGAVAGILQAIHGAGLVHRDLKPENVLLDEAGAVRLADFGLALDAHAASLTMTGAILGSLHYMAPEQVRGGAVDQRADVYALGVLAYELLTGQLPIGRFPLPSATAGVPASVDGAILRALEREPAGRWESADGFARALGAVG